MNNLNLKNKPSIEQIFNACSDAFNCSVQDIKGQKRTSAIRNARNMFCYLARMHNPKLTFFRIGMYLSDRDHSTIMHSIDRTKDLLTINDKEIKNALIVINEKLHSQCLAA